jgi:hypothetical protein
MKNTFPIILAALDLSAQDKQILKVLKTVGELSATEKAYLFHISPDFSVPENLEATFHNLFNANLPIDERMREDILKQVEETWENYPSFAFSVEIREGKPYQKLIHWLNINISRYNDRLLHITCYVMLCYVIFYFIFHFYI